MASQGYGSFDVSVAASDLAVIGQDCRRFAKKAFPAVADRNRAGVAAGVFGISRNPAR